MQPSKLIAIEFPDFQNEIEIIDSYLNKHLKSTFTSESLSEFYNLDEQVVEQILMQFYKFGFISVLPVVICPVCRKDIVVEDEPSVENKITFDTYCDNCCNMVEVDNLDNRFVFITDGEIEKISESSEVTPEVNPPKSVTSKSQNRYEKYKEKALNNPIIAIVCLIIVPIVILVGLVVSIISIVEHFSSSSEKNNQEQTPPSVQSQTEQLKSIDLGNQSHE